MQELIRAHGLDEKDYKVMTLTGSEAANALKDGNVDVFAFGGPVPVSYVTDLATQRKIYAVPVDKAKAEEFINEYPGYYLDNFPATYPNQANTSDPLGVYWKQYWVARADVDEQIVYEVTKALFERIDDLHQAHSSAKTVTIENALDDIKIPLHPGAIKYYKEAGIDIPDELIPPEMK